MKVVFPCSGSFVLLKQDYEIIKEFYNTTLLTSKLLDTYRTSNVMVQIGNFNYLPNTSSLVLYKANLLSIEKMRKILGMHQKSTSENSNNFSDNDYQTPISDSDFLSNPFFQTLKPID